LRQKGQVSIEFILIVVIALVYISGFVWPSIEIASSAATDVKAVADTKASAMKIATALDEAAVSNGDMKKTVSIFLPNGATLNCDAANNEIDYELLISYIENWEPGDCVLYIDSEGNDFTECSSSISVLQDAVPANCPEIIEGPLFRELEIEKAAGAITVAWAS